ncbi:MAG: hypothetical protein JST12_03060 [Armatimonadetes bacterium]|nr:hypothetical protein [Armatimonadota bacterium]
MNPGGGFQPQGYKVCPECRRQNELNAVACPGCGHQFRQTFNQQPSMPPQQPTAMPNPTQAFYTQPQPRMGPVIYAHPRPQRIGEAVCRISKALRHHVLGRAFLPLAAVDRHLSRICEDGPV